MSICCVNLGDRFAWKLRDTRQVSIKSHSAGNHHLPYLISKTSLLQPNSIPTSAQINSSTSRKEYSNWHWMRRENLETKNILQINLVVLIFYPLYIFSLKLILHHWSSLSTRQPLREKRRFPLFKKTISKVLVSCIFRVFYELIIRLWQN